MFIFRVGTPTTTRTGDDNNVFISGKLMCACRHKGDIDEMFRFSGLQVDFPHPSVPAGEKSMARMFMHNYIVIP